MNNNKNNKKNTYILNGERITHAEYEKEKYDDLRIRVPKGEKAKIKAFADAQGEKSLNKFIQRLIEEEMQKDIKK